MRGKPPGLCRGYLVHLKFLVGFVVLSGFVLSPGPGAQAQSVIATIGVGNQPLGVGVNATTNRIYVANENSNTVSVLQDTPPTVPTLPQWGMILLTLSLLSLASWELAGRPALLRALASGGTVAVASSPQLLSSLFVGQAVAAVGLVLYAVLIGPLVAHDAVGGFVAGVLIGVMVECYRRSPRL